MDGAYLDSVLNRIMQEVEVRLHDPRSQHQTLTGRGGIVLGGFQRVGHGTKLYCLVECLAQ